MLWALRWQVHALAAGEDEARTLGIDVPSVRLVLIVAATVMTATCVSISGIVGWVGLLIPHMVRMLVGPGFALVLPLSALIGGGFLLAVDDLARGAGGEIPLGILTALIGAPLFALVLVRMRRPGSEPGGMHASTCCRPTSSPSAYPGAPPLLHDASFGLQAGQALVLLGPNGSGKSTLAALPAGPAAAARRPRARRTGSDVHALAPSRRAALHGLRAAVRRRHLSLRRAATLVLMGRSRHLRFLGDPDARDDAGRAGSAGARRHRPPRRAPLRRR